MSKPLSVPPPGFDDLSIDDQIDYLHSLWDRIRTVGDTTPVPSWHLEIVRKRAAELESDPGRAMPWEQARAEIGERLTDG